jgi:predicted DNA-binding transcriptional regulator AlpA
MQISQNVASNPQSPYHAAPHIDRLVSRKEVLGIIGISNATLWRWIKSGRFPTPLKIGARKVAWRTSIVTSWIEARTAQACRA